MNTRKNFLIGSSLLAFAPAAAKAASPKPQHASLTFTFDRARFDEILAKPAKHKQCFGATKIARASVIDGMNNTIDAYEHYLGEPAGSVHTVAVLYHGAAIALGFDDAVWNELLIPAIKAYPPEAREQFSDVAPGMGNPYAKNVAAAVARGSSFFLCHNAIAGFSPIIAVALNRPVEDVHASMLRGVLPGALVVPAGVMAINAAQEAKFTYIQSSL